MRSPAIWQPAVKNPRRVTVYDLAALFSKGHEGLRFVGAVTTVIADDTPGGEVSYDLPRKFPWARVPDGPKPLDLDRTFVGFKATVTKIQGRIPCLPTKQPEAGPIEIPASCASTNPCRSYSGSAMCRTAQAWIPAYADDRLTKLSFARSNYSDVIHAILFRRDRTKDAPIFEAPGPPRRRWWNPQICLDDICFEAASMVAARRKFFFYPERQEIVGISFERLVPPSASKPKISSE